MSKTFEIEPIGIFENQKIEEHKIEKPDPYIALQLRVDNASYAATDPSIICNYVSQETFTFNGRLVDNSTPTIYVIFGSDLGTHIYYFPGTP